MEETEPGEFLRQPSQGTASSLPPTLHINHASDSESGTDDDPQPSPSRIHHRHASGGIEPPPTTHHHAYLEPPTSPPTSRRKNIDKRPVLSRKGASSFRKTVRRMQNDVESQTTGVIRENEAEEVTKYKKAGEYQQRWKAAAIYARATKAFITQETDEEQPDQQEEETVYRQYRLTGRQKVSIHTMDIDATVLLRTLFLKNCCVLPL